MKEEKDEEQAPLVLNLGWWRSAVLFVRSYLPWVVIFGLTYWNVHQDSVIEKKDEIIIGIYRKMDEEKMEAIKVWRDAYRKQAENNFDLMKQKIWDDEKGHNTHHSND